MIEPNTKVSDHIRALEEVGHEWRAEAALETENAKYWHSKCKELEDELLKVEKDRNYWQDRCVKALRELGYKGKF